MLRNTNNIVEERVPDFLIITNNELKSAFQTLAFWKTKKGIPTVIETIEEIEQNYIGTDLTEKIRNFIQDAQNRWNGNSLNILLGGNFDVVPAKIVKSDYNEVGFQATDIYYVAEKFTWDIRDKSCLSSDISSYLGRIPVKNITEAKNFVNKIIDYEKAAMNISEYSYFHNFLFSGAYMEDEANDGHMKLLDNYRKEYLKTPANYWYLFDHFKCTKKDHQEQNYDNSQGEELNKTNFISALQKGTDIGHIHFVLHEDHSVATALGISTKDKSQSIGNEDVDKLSYSPYYHIIVSCSCHPANFYLDCVAEHLLNKTGGTIAFIGNTDIGWRSEYNQFEKFLKTIFNNSSSSISQYNMGYLYYNLLSTTNHRLHLLGDPTLSVWTDTPKRLDVFVSPTTVTSGENLITVKVNNLPYGQKALICLMKEEEGYATLTVDGPQAHTFTFTPRTSGTLYVTVTAHNYIPYENELQVKAAEIPAVYISDVLFKEDKTGSSIGNGDGQLDAGETVDVTVKLKNSGNNLAGAVRGILSCNSDHIEMMNREADFGSITPNGIAYSKTKFTFRIKENTPEIQKNDFNAIRFQLNIVSGNNIVFTDTFKIEVRSPEIALAGQKIKSTSNGDLIPQPGETIKFQVSLTNKGKAQAVGVWATLSSTSPFVKNCMPIKAEFLPIGRNETQTGNLLLSVWLKDSYVTGTANLAVSSGEANGRTVIIRENTELYVCHC